MAIETLYQNVALVSLTRLSPWYCPSISSRWNPIRSLPKPSRVTVDVNAPSGNVIPTTKELILPVKIDRMPSSKQDVLSFFRPFVALTFQLGLKIQWMIQRTLNFSLNGATLSTSSLHFVRICLFQIF